MKMPPNNQIGNTGFKMQLLVVKYIPIDNTISSRRWQNVSYRVDYEKIARLRKLKGYTQETMAAELGYHGRFISKGNRGKAI